MVVFNGHGSDDTISGHGGEPIIQAGVNDSLLKGRITYARSCWAGNTSIQAHEKSKKQTLKTIKKILRSGTKEAFLFAEKLWNNYTGQVLIGNESAIL
jgi:ABC-type proline/glycine betaine transport system substrate-binding protein